LKRFPSPVYYPPHSVFRPVRSLVCKAPSDNLEEQLLKMKCPPLGVLVDYGGTLVQELRFDPEAGNVALLESLGQTQRPGAIRRLSTALSERARSATSVAGPVEAPWVSVTRLALECEGIEPNIPLERLEQIFWNAAVTTAPMPEVVAALRSFHRESIPVGVVSNCSFRSSILVSELAKHGLDQFLSFVMSSADYAIKKPHPTLFRAAARRLRCEPEGIWFVGDSLECDVAGAAAAGMIPIWFAGPCNDVHTLPWNVAPSWSDVIRLWEKSKEE
jgi:HAD superfamily hydrolase (TIGR01662 family)